MSKLAQQAQAILDICTQVEANDSAALASVLGRMSAKLWCRLGESADWLALCERYARMERTYHGEVPIGHGAAGMLARLHLEGALDHASGFSRESFYSA